MGFSSDDFDNWQRSQAPAHGADSPAGAAPVPIVPDVVMTGMPTFARMRLQEHVKKSRCSFTSNLSVNEFLLSRKLGYDPVAQVQGASVYHVGWQWMPYSMFLGQGELSVLTEAHLDAWRLSIQRLQQQAQVAGAHTVLSAEHKRRSFDTSFSEDTSGGEQPTMIEVQLTGTAVRFRGEAQTGPPLVSTISGQEFLALRHSGYYPAGIVYGCCVYYQPSYWSYYSGTGSTVAWGTQWQNQELTDFTNGLSTARNWATQRMYGQAQALGAAGVLDAEVHCAMREIERDVNDRKQVGIVITYEAMGTAIFETEPNAVTDTALVISLADTPAPIAGG
jgi:uncharacterized protein YbjQ (UPF0145 family)